MKAKRVIIDECLPRKLKRLIPRTEAKTVPEAGFAGLKNGKLLFAIQTRFEVFVTIDANLEYQQNLKGLDFGIVVIHAKSNRFADLAPMGAELEAAVERVAPGEVINVPSDQR